MGETALKVATTKANTDRVSCPAILLQILGHRDFSRLLIQREISRRWRHALSSVLYLAHDILIFGADAEDGFGDFAELGDGHHVGGVFENGRELLADDTDCGNGRIAFHRRVVVARFNVQLQKRIGKKVLLDTNNKLHNKTHFKIEKTQSVYWYFRRQAIVNFHVFEKTSKLTMKSSSTVSERDFLRETSPESGST